MCTRGSQRIVTSSGCRVWVFERIPRQYYQTDEDKRAAVRGHVGTHPAILEQVASSCGASLRQLADAVHGSRQTMNVVVYCRAGQKRSVALATIMYHCLAGVTGLAPAYPEHLCEGRWFHTCRGVCENCTGALATDIPQRIESVGRAVALFRDSLQALRAKETVEID